MFFKFRNCFSSLGFSLIELMVAIAIIGVVFGVIISSATGLRKNERDSRRQADLRIIQAAIEQWYADHGSYPSQPFFNGASNPVGGQFKDTTTGSVYLNSLPGDPSDKSRYPYRGIKPDGVSTGCDNSSSIDMCIKYCIYAKMEGSTLAGTCQGITTPGTNNYWVTQP